MAKPFSASYRKFLRVYGRACDLLDDLGIPFRDDPECQVFFDDRWHSEANLWDYSFYSRGEITLCRNHLSDTLDAGTATLLHEVTHYFCDRFPQAMKKGHVFRVPRRLDWVPFPKWLVYGLKSALHQHLYDEDDERFLGAYSQVTSEECLCEFMSTWIVYRPDLRSLPPAKRARFQACERMLAELRRAYRAA